MLLECIREYIVLIQILVSDYVGFIKKIMKLMQHKYHQLKILEVELRQEVCGSPPQGMYRIYNSVSFFFNTKVQ